MKLNLKKSEYIQRFRNYLITDEKSSATIEKYCRDVVKFYNFADGREISKELTISYKVFLEQYYAPMSVNSMIASLNKFLKFAGKDDCCIKQIKIQRQFFCQEEKELTIDEYKRLLKAAGETRIAYILQTICGTGIRISELRFITVEAAERGRTTVKNKEKSRVILISSGVQEILKNYIKKTGIKTGPVFVSKNGKPLNRCNIWRDMKELCDKAGVCEKKVYPHNLRHLFARTFYTEEKDIVLLADLLGHSSINTTRIYTIESGTRHVSSLERVQKILTT